MSFRIGDKVRVKAVDSWLCGFVGVVKEITKAEYGDTVYDVQTAEGKGLYYDYELEEYKIDG